MGTADAVRSNGNGHHSLAALSSPLNFSPLYLLGGPLCTRVLCALGLRFSCNKNSRAEARLDVALLGQKIFDGGIYPTLQPHEQRVAAEHPRLSEE